MHTCETLIIGAGLTGLSCAFHLGRDHLLVEKENEPGGLVRTRRRPTDPEARARCGEFLCDGTGHWLHLRTPEMRALVERLLPGQLIEHERRAVIHLAGAFTPYPFQANTYGLPREIVLDCLLGLIRARHPEDFGLQPPADPPRHFRESLERLFGAGICRHFMVPYNEKLLGVPLEEISPTYAERFIPRPSLEDVVKGALGFSRESLGYNAKFVYPRAGGIGALSRALADALPQPPRYNAEVRSVHLRTKTARVTVRNPSVTANASTTATSEQVVRFERLVNTMSLPEFVARIEDAPENLRAAAARLRATTVHYFDVGVRGPGDAASQYHWIYFPEPQFVFYRVGSYSAVHADAAPPGCRSYYVEMSGGDARALLGQPEALRTRVLDDLRRARVLGPNDEVLFMELCRIPNAYVIFDAHYESARREVIETLAAHGVHSCGRWGGWNYGGMEDALLEGRAAAAVLRETA
ncbi:MAG: FAD-dependent oxidoreductase [Verrucomicrobiae bacterium]|nr:FAD-dependent oxidoreductase [Verrucomicrobiae bacterium]